MRRFPSSVPNKMLAVMIKEFKGLPEVGEVPVSEPGPGNVLVKMAAAPVNPSDIAFMKGGYGNPKDFPLIPGFEGSGTVIAAGPGFATRFLLGKRVACATSGNYGGTWAEYVVTSAASCIPLPKSLSLEQGATAIVNPMTAIAFLEMAKSEKHLAMINTAAAGALGRMILRLGLREKIPVINIVRKQDQVDLLRSIGGEHILRSTDPEFPDRLRRLSHDLKATLILDAVGGQLTKQMIEASPFGSAIVIYGFLSGAQPAIDTRLLAKEEKRIIGFFLPNWLKRKHPLIKLNAIRKMRKLLASDLATIVQKRFPFTEINKALEAAEGPMTSGKVLLTMDRG